MSAFNFLVGLFSQVKSFYLKNEKLIGTAGTVLKFVLAEVNIPPKLLIALEFIKSNALRIKLILESSYELGPLRVALSNCQTSTDEAAWECIVREARSYIIMHPEYLNILLKNFTTAIISLLQREDKNMEGIEVASREANLMAEKAYNKLNKNNKLEKAALKELSGFDRVKYNQFFEKLAA